MKKLTVPRVLMVLLKVPVLKIQIHTMKICQLWKGQRDLQSVCEIPHFFSFFFTKSLVITSMFISSELLSVLSMLTVSD
jgi:hypothetical protein